MQGRLENQLKIEKRIQNILLDLPKEVNEYYINMSTDKEFRSCLEYVNKVKRFLVWYSENFNVSLQKIDFSLITDIEIAQYLKTKEIKNNVDGDIEFTTFSYRGQTLSILKGFFDFLFKKKYIESNPVLLLNAPRKKDKVERIFLKEKELDKIIDAINEGAGNSHAIHRQEKWKSRDLAIFYTFILTGMRESALCEIDLNKVDFENNTIEVIDKEHKHNTYKMPNKLKTYLLAWLDDRKGLIGDIDCNALFISNQRKRISAGTVSVLIKKYSQEAIGKNISPHKLRAAYGNLIYRKTHDMKLVKGGLKHEKIDTSLIYVEDDEKEINDRVANIMENIF